jgi:hypothetical protein
LLLLAQTTADAGSESEENYTDLEDENITAFVKYNYFYKEQLDNNKEQINPFAPHELHYNKDKDVYYCPIRTRDEKYWKL